MLINRRSEQFELIDIKEAPAMFPSVVVLPYCEDHLGLAFDEGELRMYIQLNRASERVRG